MRITYDNEADALYVPVRPGASVARSVIVDDDRVVDIDAEGRAVGIEVLGASHGVHLLDLIARFSLTEFYDAFREIETHPFRARAYA